MASISAVLIVKNEEKKLADCLKSLQWVDEVVILDSGSTDSTLDIARDFSVNFFANIKVSVNKEWQGFGVQRERAAALATSDWIFMIDADERVTEELAQEMKTAVQGQDAVYMVNRLSWCFGRFIKHSGLYPDWVPRLYPRNKAGFDKTRVHERLVNSQQLPVKKFSAHLLHYVYDSIRHQQQKAAHYAEEWACQKAAAGKSASLTKASLHALTCFLRMYIFRGGFLDGKQGFLLATLLSQATFAKYAELWNLKNRI